MNSKQTNKKNMYNKLLVFFAANANASIWAAFTRLVDEIARFVNINKDLDKAAQKQGTVTKGITDGKNKLRLKMAKLLVKNARKARVWAHDAANSDLEAVFNVQVDDFTRGAEDDSVTDARLVHKALSDNAGSLGGVNITATDINDIKKSIDDFEASLGTPGAAEGEKKSGTETLVDLFEEADTSLDLIDDLLIHEYEDTHAEMVEAYRSDRKVDDIGVHHTGLHSDILFKSNGQPAEGITMRIVELNRQGISNINGVAEVRRCKPGTYHVEFSGAGITTITMIVKIERGHIVKLRVEV